MAIVKQSYISEVSGSSATGSVRHLEVATSQHHDTDIVNSRFLNIVSRNNHFWHPHHSRLLTQKHMLQTPANTSESILPTLRSRALLRDTLQHVLKLQVVRRVKALAVLLDLERLGRCQRTNLEVAVEFAAQRKVEEATLHQQRVVS
jgi:hypothetical protein